MKSACLAMFLALAAISSGQAGTFDREYHHRAQFDQYPPVRPAVVLSQQSAPLTSGASLLDDAAVSESVAPARFDQANADMARLIDGGWVIVWDDDRRGVRKIFRQRYTDAGVPIGGNELVAGSMVGADYVEPKIETDTLGRVHLFFRDRTNGLIFARRYLADLTVDLDSYIVSDTASDAFAGPYDVALYPNGRFVVVWENYASTGSGIRARIINSAGSFVTGPITVNTDVGDVSHWAPSVAVRPNAGFLVAWEDYRNGQADIVARLFDGNGGPVSVEFAVVPPPSSLVPQYAPKVAYLSGDRYAIAWVDLRLGQDVFLQIYNTNTGASGANRLVSSGDGVTIHWDIDLAVDPAGRLLAAWAAFAEDAHILVQRFDLNTDPIGLPAAHNLATTGQRWSPSAVFLAEDSYALTWAEIANAEVDLNLMKFDSSAVRQLGAEEVVNDDTQGAESSSPSIAAAGDFYTLFAYADRRRDNGDIYVRSINHALMPVAASVRVNQDNGTALQSEPDIDAVLNDEGLIVWIDGRSIGGISGQRIFARYVDRWGGFVTSEMTVSDSLQTAAKSSPQATLNSARRGLVAWLDRRSGVYQVYGRWLNADHSRDGGEFLISDDASGIAGGSLRTATSGDNRFYASWINVGTTPPSVETVWFRANKTLGGSFNYAPVLAGGGLVAMAIAGYPNGDLALAWTGLENDVLRLYLSVFDSTGALVGGSADIVTDHEQARAMSPAVSVDENGYVSLCWTDHRAGKAVAYYQVFDDVRNAVGVNEPLGSVDVETMKTPVTAAARGRAWFGWVDNRVDGFNVYGANWLYLATDVDDQPEPTLPRAFELLQNYPNPFNPTTTISYSLPRSSHARLTVFNLLGQEVKVLVDEPQAAGTYDIEWDGTDRSGRAVASGVYFCRMDADGFSEQRKMMLLK